MAARSKTFDMELLFRALADRTRLRLLNLMDGQEICVCYFTEVTGESQPKISRHLAYLRRAGVVAARRDGKWMHYRTVQPSHTGASRMLKEVMVWLREEKQMQADRTKLTRACCSPKKFVSIASAPMPSSVVQTGACL